jgi:MYXO-CTERM domain-containing protein
MARNRQLAVVQVGGLFVATFGAFGLMSHEAAAQDTNTLVIKPSILQLMTGQDNGEMGKNTGPGNEQPVSVYTTKDGRSFITTVYMTSIGQDMYWQGMCSSVELTKEGPKPLADNQLTYVDVNHRPFNHPRMAWDGEDLLLLYGSDEMDDEQTATYVHVLDPETCQLLTETPTLVSDNPNNDCGAGDIVANAPGKFTAGYLDAGGGGKSTSIGLRVDKSSGDYNIEVTYRTVVHTPGNIGRATIAAMGPDRSIHCSAMGQQRPPDYGVSCSILDTSTGDILHQEYIAESDKLQKIYWNQPQIMHLEDNKFVVMALRSNGDGRKTNDKGSNTMGLWVLEASDTGFVRLAESDDLDISWQTHASICTGAYGVDGEKHIGVVGAPVTGAGQPTMQMVQYLDNKLLVDKRNEFITAPAGDSGHLANIYGANPNNQGRDFMFCAGDIPNPGFEGGEGAFMPEVETLWVMPVAGKKSGQSKNALFLSLVPGKSAVALTGSEEAPDEPADPGEEGPNSPTTTTDNEQADGCSCRAVGSQGNSSSNPAGLAALLGLGLLGVASRRRRRS